MQTILGAGGAIGKPLAKELKNYTDKIRLAARNPEKINEDDELFICDLLDKKSTMQAVANSSIAYLTVGLEYKLKTWQRDWPVLMENVIDACLYHNCKLVFLDNVYMYDIKNIPHMTETSEINPPSEKGKVRAQLVHMIFDAIQHKGLQALIARSADFYGPGANASAMKIGVTDKLLKNSKPFWQADANKIHSMTYTCDAAKATALLGNTPEAYNQVWHLPTSSEKLTGADYIKIATEAMNKPNTYSVYKKGFMKMIGWFVPSVKELVEMLYQNDRDYFFDSSKFTRTFNFETTSYKDGIKSMIEYYK